MLLGRAFRRFGQVTAYPSPDATVRMRNNQNIADVASYDGVYTHEGDWLGQAAKSAPRLAMVATDESATTLPNNPQAVGLSC